MRCSEPLRQCVACGPRTSRPHWLLPAYHSSPFPSKSHKFHDPSRPLSLDSSEAPFAGLIPFFVFLLYIQRPTANDERRMTQPSSFFYWLRYHLACPWTAYNGYPSDGNLADCPCMTSPTRSHVMCGRCSFHVRFNVRCSSFLEFHLPLAILKAPTLNPDLPGNDLTPTNR